MTGYAGPAASLLYLRPVAVGGPGYPAPHPHSADVRSNATVPSATRRQQRKPSSSGSNDQPPAAGRLRTARASMSPTVLAAMLLASPE